MARKFSELEAKMPPQRLARAKARAKEVMAEMLLAEIRKEMGLTQEGIVASLGIKQPSLSKLESQDDMQISTLRRLVSALGGELELIAHLPRGDIRLCQFTENGRMLERSGNPDASGGEWENGWIRGLVRSVSYFPPNLHSPKFSGSKKDLFTAFQVLCSRCPSMTRVRAASVSLRFSATPSDWCP